MTEIKLSIVTIAFNAGKTIERTLRSVVEQKNEQIEYIVIDGLSSDDTVQRTDPFRQNIDVFISEKDQGIADAFNKGMKLAKGEFILYLNADDWLENDSLKKILPQLQEKDVYHANIRYWKNDHADLISIGNHHHLLKEMSINHTATFMRRTTMLQLNGFRLLEQSMDYDLMIRAYVEGATFQHIDSLVVNMSWGGESDNYWKKALRTNYNIKNEAFGHKPQHKLWYLKQWLSIFTIKSLEFLGLKKVVSAYRSKNGKWSNEG